jgi:hydroxyacylglutathione hydrolase
MKTEIFHIKLGLNSCYLIRGKEIVMVDGGLPNKLKEFKKELARLGINPSEIKLIVLTHSHMDHAGSAKEISDLTGAKIVAHQSESKYLENESMLIPKGVTFSGKITKPILFPFLSRIKFPRFKPDILLTGEPMSLSEYGINGSVIHTPGHTPGSLSVVLDSGEAFVGCMAHNGLPFRLRPGLPIYAMDIDEVKRSWKLLLEKGVKMVYPGHGNPFPVEIMKKTLNYN